MLAARQASASPSGEQRSRARCSWTASMMGATSASAPPWSALACSLECFLGPSPPKPPEARAPACSQRPRQPAAARPAAADSSRALTAPPCQGAEGPRLRRARLRCPKPLLPPGCSRVAGCRWPSGRTACRPDSAAAACPSCGRLSYRSRSQRSAASTTAAQHQHEHGPRPPRGPLGGAPSRSRPPRSRPPGSAGSGPSCSAR
mmetsp:Transcript_37661/g.111770  ORF Transcript_37661/g.111770 Transcript_37661/m.111770 type:complete len:203 (-) Transcript_37661:260-868(-)